MPVFQIKLIDKQLVAKDTLLLIFEKPALFSFIPGQYCGFTLLTPIDGNGTRRFSLLSSPLDNVLSIVTRIQPSAYKEALLNMAKGESIKIAGPTGNFLLHEDKHTPAVLIAGGIGIAPFYSMIIDALQKKINREIILFHGNQSIDHAAFLTELTTLSQKNPHFRFIPIMLQSENWQGEVGYITHTMIQKYITDLSKPIYYLCGSLTMVNALKELLLEMSIEEDRIKFEDFPGY